MYGIMAKPMSYKDAVIEFQKQQAEMRSEIHENMEVIISNQASMMTRQETHQERLDRHMGQIDALQKNDKRITGMAAAITAIGVWIRVNFN